MNNKNLSLIIGSLILIFVVAPLSITSAQNSSNEDIPSDLFLDLSFGKKNPAPEQKAIVESQTNEVTTVASNGKTSVETPKDIIPEEVKTEKASESDHPEQTTSEQVVSISVPENSESPEPESSPKSSESNVPGTSVVEPDDNAAQPLPSSLPENEQASPNPSPENNSSNEQPVISPSENTQAPVEQQTEQSTPAPESTGSGSVQGASTANLPWWEKFLKILKR